MRQCEMSTVTARKNLTWRPVRRACMFVLSHPLLRKEWATRVCGNRRKKQILRLRCAPLRMTTLHLLLWGDDASDRGSLGEVGGVGTGYAHGFGDHVYVFEAGAGVEDDDALAGLQESCLDEVVVGGGGGG